MTYPLMTTANGYNLTQGLQVPLQYVNQTTHGLFMMMFLALLWLGVTITSYFAQVRRKGDANFLATFCVVGLAVILFMLLLTAFPSITGLAYTSLVTTTQLLIAVVLEIIFVFIWFISERNQY